MHAQIILRKIAAAAVDLFCLSHAAGNHLELCADTETVALGSGKLKAGPVTAGDTPIAQKYRSAVEIANHHVNIAVIKEIANGETPRDTLLCHYAFPCDKWDHDQHWA